MAQEQPSIAYLGPKTSYTSQVARKAFPETEYLHLPNSTLENVFDAVQSGIADRGVAFLENSSNGPVIDTLNLLADKQGLHPDICASGSTTIKIMAAHYWNVRKVCMFNG
jgi:prephenate dehydratase